MLEWYALALVAAITILVSLLLVRGETVRAPFWVIAALASASLLAEQQSVQITPNTKMSVSALPILFAAMAGGPLGAMLVGGSALLADFGRPYTRWVIWTASRCIVAGFVGVVAIAAMPSHVTFARLLVAVAIAAAAEAVLDIFFNALTGALRKTSSFVETVRAMSRLTFLTTPLYAPLIGVLVYAYEVLSPWSALLFFVPALAAQRLFVLYQEQRRLAVELASANKRLETSGLSFASALVAALDARDRYTAGHSAAVAVYARDIAGRIGLSMNEQQLAHLCGLLHDVGKVGLPPSILEKTGPLTLAERRRMEAHSVIGERILANVDQYSEIARIVRYHHERVDGNGYPDGLRGGAIPLLSRIIAVADAYNAMTSGRPYRDAMPSAVARMRLAQAVETQFDTTVVAAFEALLAGASEAYLAGNRADFALEAQRQPSLAPQLATSAA